MTGNDFCSFLFIFICVVLEINVDYYFTAYSTEKKMTSLEYPLALALIPRSPDHGPNLNTPSDSSSLLHFHFTLTDEGYF